MARTIIIYVLAAVALMFDMPCAFARALHMSAAKDFADASMVSDKELATLRGGMFNNNGMLISFTYSSVTTINGVTQTNNTFTDTDLAQAIANGKNPLSLIPSTVLQNASDGTQLAVKNQLDLAIQNAGIIAAHSQLHQATLQNALAFH